MDKTIEKITTKLKGKRKKIIRGIVGCSILILAVGALGTGFIYNKVKSNVNYTEEQAKEIALAQFPGDVLLVTKDIELERLSYEYDIKIKDSNNMLREVSVDAKLGVISDID